MNSKQLGLTEQDFSEIIETCTRYPEVQRAIVFGSRAKGTYQRGSDVDLALQGPFVTRHILRKINAQLNEVYALPYFFDLVHYEALHSVALLAHIDRVGITIYPSFDGAEDS